MFEWRILQQDCRLLCSVLLKILQYITDSTNLAEMFFQSAIYASEFLSVKCVRSEKMPLLFAFFSPGIKFLGTTNRAVRFYSLQYIQVGSQAQHV